MTSYSQGVSEGIGGRIMGVKGDYSLRNSKMVTSWPRGWLPTMADFQGACGAKFITSELSGNKGRESMEFTLHDLNHSN